MSARLHVPPARCCLPRLTRPPEAVLVTPQSRSTALCLALCLGLSLIDLPFAAGAEPKSSTKPAAKPAAEPAPADALLKAEPWQKAPQTPVMPEEIDRLIAGEQATDPKANVAPRTTDEQFIRRAT